MGDRGSEEHKFMRVRGLIKEMFVSPGTKPTGPAGPAMGGRCVCVWGGVLCYIVYKENPPKL
jgi:hypothetical protein